MQDDSSVIYLWGPEGVGKTHLLQAVCWEATVHRKRVAFIPLTQTSDHQLTAEVLHGYGQFDVVCVDVLEQLPSDDMWQLALIDLYHRLEENAGNLYLSGRCPVASLPVRADLSSRISAGFNMRLHPLSDDTRSLVLQERAKARGFELSESVCAFIMKRFSRNMHSLLHTLDVLDQYSLADKRRITVPYVRQLLDETDEFSFNALLINDPVSKGEVS